MRNILSVYTNITANYSKFTPEKRCFPQSNQGLLNPSYNVTGFKMNVNIFL